MQKIKLGVHVAQAVLIFVAWCINIALFRSSASINGRVGWYFGLCFLSIPALIYLTMTPLFPRSRKFANPYAFAGVDIVFTILWLSGFAAMAAFNNAGSCKKSCGLSDVMIAVGVFVFLFFILTSAISLYGVSYYKRNGTLPGAPVRSNAAMIDPDKEAFSTAPHGEEYAPVHDNELDDNHMGGLSGGDSFAEHRYDNTSYSGYVQPQVSDTRPVQMPLPSQMGYGGSAAPAERTYFPPANYD